jgi:hypothetical protein
LLREQITEVRNDELSPLRHQQELSQMHPDPEQQPERP